MRASRVFHAVDSHTEGMPTRVITGGVGVLPGDTMLERKLRFERERDWIRTLLMHEPRGHGAMSGAILQPPCRDDADWGVVYIEVSGCLPMCGHGTIGVATVQSPVTFAEPVRVVSVETKIGPGHAARNAAALTVAASLDEASTNTIPTAGTRTARIRWRSIIGVSLSSGSDSRWHPC